MNLLRKSPLIIFALTLAGCTGENLTEVERIQKAHLTELDAQIGKWNEHGYESYVMTVRFYNLLDGSLIDTTYRVQNNIPEQPNGRTVHGDFEKARATILEYNSEDYELTVRYDDNLGFVTSCNLYPKDVIIDGSSFVASVVPINDG